MARWLRLFLVLALLVGWQVAGFAEPLVFRVRLEEQVAEEPITGRLFVFLSRGPDGREPRFGPSWFAPEPFFGREVKQMKPGEWRELDEQADGFPDKLSKLPAGTYRIQALLDHDFFDSHHARGVGNFYSDVLLLKLDPAATGTVELVLDKTVEAEQPFESDWVKPIRVRSGRLSEFHRRDVAEPAVVVLPASYYDQPQRRYPVIYWIAGFGGNHERLARMYRRGPPQAGEGEVEYIRVLLAGQCKWGHHEYANSATNGPRGDALVYEMIPHIDRQFRTVAAPTARFVTGPSSGGWSSLWLEVTYPDTFGGVWSIAPDPVDFRDFQRIDLYHEPPLSMYRDEQGNRRPIARRGDTPVLWYEDFCRMDDCLGRGGQMRSFEAVFSPLGADGLPRRLWSRTDGRIDPDVAEAWKKYDINLVLKGNWDRLGPKLQGKLHIIAAEYDTFYLEGAVRLLGQTLEDLGSDAEVQIVPGANHSSVMSPALRRRMDRQMSEAYLKHHTRQGRPRERDAKLESSLQPANGKLTCRGQTGAKRPALCDQVQRLALLFLERMSRCGSTSVDCHSRLALV